jgi:hypothetical protein
MAEAGEGHQPGARDPVGQQPPVAWVDDGIGVALQDQRAGPDTGLPLPRGIAGARDRLGRQRAAVRRVPRAALLELQQTADEFGLVLDGPRGQGVLGEAAPFLLGAQAGGPDELSHRGHGHGIGERPARRGAGQDQGVDPLRVGDGQFLGHQAAQARPQHVGPANTGIVEHGQDVTGHVGHAEPAGPAVAVPEPAVVDEDEAEVTLEVRQHGLPASAVEAHALDQDQPGPPPAQGAAQLVSDARSGVRLGV